MEWNLPREIREGAAGRVGHIHAGTKCYLDRLNQYASLFNIVITAVPNCASLCQHWCEFVASIAICGIGPESS